jgi:hypothetical protein
MMLGVHGVTMTGTYRDDKVLLDLAPDISYFRSVTGTNNPQTETLSNPWHKGMRR